MIGRAYVANEGPGNVSVIDIQTNTKIKDIGVGVSHEGIAITPDGKRAYVANGGSKNVSVIDIQTNTNIKTIGVGSFPKHITIT